MPTLRLLACAVLAFAAPLAAADPPAGGLEYPLSNGSLTMSAGARPSRRQLDLRARWRGAGGAVYNPREVVATLRIAGGAGEGDSGVVHLVAERWRDLGRGRGFRYRDPRGTAGGIRSVVVRFRRSGGSVAIAGGRHNWRYALDRPQSLVTATLSIGPARWCAEFRPPFRTSRTGRLVAETSSAPASCPCNASFESTWASLQTAVFERHGCTAAPCHGSGASGGLDLRPEAAYRQLVDVPSAAVPGMKRVEPGDQERSLLWRKLAKATLGGFADVPGAAMPNGEEAPLSEDELAAVARWIRGGAPEHGIVADTDRLLTLCLPPPDPIKIRPPDPPAPDEGVQLYAPPWALAPQSEGEVCFATYHDLSNVIPLEQQVPCPAEWGGPAKRCFLYSRSEFTQDPNSHHSIIHAYRGAYDVTHAGFGPFTCHGGALDGQPCNPLGTGVPAPGGADCGAGGGCAGRVVPAIACLGYGPPDFSAGFEFPFGVDTQNAPAIIIATEPLLSTRYAPGVFAVLPVTGTMVWNSHAFNTTDQPTTNEQWMNLYFAAPADRRYPVQDVFVADDIFVQDVPPFEQREYCKTHTFDPGTRLFELSSHTHKRGRLFRVWGPGIWPPCSSRLGDVCLPETGPPVLVTTDYSDPAQVRLDPPLALDGDAASRTYKFCALYDNGFTDPSEVRRGSATPPLANPCDRRCLNEGPARGTLCGGVDAQCDSTPGAGNGVCDACTLRGGVTTDDEMFILLGAYYCVEGSTCFLPPP